MALPVLYLGAEAPTEDTDQGEVTSIGTATTVLRLGPFAVTHRFDLTTRAS